MPSRAAALLAVLLAAVTAGCGSRARPNLAGTAWPADAPAHDFALRDQDGRPVRLSSERGRFVVVAFLYTRCPDVCPLVAAQLNSALRGLGRLRDDVRVLAVSVDPRGDTPRAVRAFVRGHRLLAQFRYLTGTRAVLRRVWRDYGVGVDPRNLDLVDHTAYELLIDRDGRPRVSYGSNVRAADVAHDLRLLGLQ